MIEWLKKLLVGGTPRFDDGCYKNTNIPVGSVSDGVEQFAAAIITNPSRFRVRMVDRYVDPSGYATTERYVIRDKCTGDVFGARIVENYVFTAGKIPTSLADRAFYTNDLSKVYRHIGGKDYSAAGMTAADIVYVFSVVRDVVDKYYDAIDNRRVDIAMSSLRKKTRDALAVY